MACSSSPNLIFVYGTLKKGHPNMKHMPATTEYIGTATTKEALPLVVGTEMNIPFLLNVAQHPGAHRVQGEIYLADRYARDVLDEFEGVSSGFYDRLEVDVVLDVVADGRGDVGDAGDCVQASAYFRSESNMGPVWARDWTVEKLRQLDMIPSYTLVEAGRYRSRDRR